MPMQGALIKPYSLTTAEILYRLPDHPSLLQTFIWQNLDLAPHFPELRRFLEFWQRELDGKLFQVRVAARDIMERGHMRWANLELRLQ
jgi:uncharacterized protein Usg